jgi:alkanesulfonate monooxygenase SsuD/methylene tetrahydromethanopterin reductase-like flavin-dependent oxidoreductase (luciferase family)
MSARGLPASALLAELTEEVTAAEEAGFSLALVPEHHDGPPGSLPDPLTVTAWLLARTNRIVIGPGVLLLPLHHPLHVAEQSSLLQQASGDRLVLAVGCGYQAHDFDRFGVDRADRVRLLEQGVDDIRTAWASGLVSLEQGHRPPIWLGTWSDAGVRRAAQLADGWLVDPIRSLAELEPMVRSYHDATTAAVRDPRIILIREAWVAETNEQARRTFSPVIEPIYRYYLRRGAFPSAVPTPDQLTLEGGLADRVLCGAPETVTDQLVEAAKVSGARTCVLALRHPSGPPHDDVLRAIRLLGQQVLPAVRARLTEVAA